MGAKRSKTLRKAAASRLDLESPFDRLTALACAMFDMPHAMIGVCDGDRTVFRANVGLGQSEMPRGLTATNMVASLGPGAVLVIEDALADERVRNHPMVAGKPHLRFFAGVGVVNAVGESVGAIGVMDTRARSRPSDAEIENLKLLARMAGEILDRAEAARQQEEQLELLRLTEQMAGVGRWRMDAETFKSTWSDRVYAIYGVTPETFDPGLDDAIAFFHPEDRARVQEAVIRGLQTGEGFRTRARLIRADGLERLVETHAKTERGPDGRVKAMIGVFQDVTEAEQAVLRITESERRYRLLASRVTDVIVTYGVDGLVTYVSPSLEAATGYPPEALMGRPATSLIHPDDIPALTESFREFVKAPPEYSQRGVTYRGLPRDGEVRWFEARTSIIRDDNGRVIEFQDVVRDVTDTKRLEEALIEARDRAEAGAQAKSEFLANMSHELRTPLTSVIGFSGLLEASANLPPAERMWANRIATASDALLGVINDILDYSKLEADAVDLDPQPFDPRAMAEGAAAIVESQCLARGLTLTVDVAAGLPAALMGDEGRLRQVTLNFLSNAVKFTSTGDIRLTVAEDSGQLRVAVSDSGIGIAPEKISQLFDRFTQADASTTRVYGGTGLGLAISHRLIEMMGGEIGADSTPGEGSTFWFRIPMRSATTTEMQADPTEMADPAGLRVLLADDASANRELVAAIMGGLGVDLDTVCNGAEAVEAARSGDYDLILMDVHMPVMDGLAATRAIRGMGGAVARTPIVALTANVQPDHVERCLAAGMNGHVGKPIQLAELLTAMNRAMQAARDGAESEADEAAA
ncbi:PAS domain-containing protein [Brevundimonas sp.]|uniref:PAS domain-containing protein n=1 Tax=Brevundimonas sp. TaxID=1871086 RepID=UPI002BB7F50D|nr:PAS domain-containing protein [Brevundimonas sp.]HWQ86243.1 PAS domain-containing protein [Brevundimonas sp.]